MKFLTSRKIFAFMVVALLLSSISVRAEKTTAINDIKFPLELWSDGLLSIIDAGSTNIIDSEYKFEVKPYPVNDSQTTKDEIAYLLEIVKTQRTDYNIKRIIYENNSGMAHEFFIKEGIIDAENHKVINLIKLIGGDHTYFILKSKKHFSRPRPSQLSSELKLVLPNPGHASYPSGHASQAYMVALILSDFDPYNAEIYKQCAIDIAHRREIAGFHYPSDSIAGRKLAVDVLAKLREDKEFEDEYQEAKASFIVSDQLPNDKEIEHK